MGATSRETTMALELGLFRFPGVHDARRVLATLQTGPLAKEAWLSEVGTVERHRSGRVSLRATWHGEDFEEEEGEVPLIASVLGGLTGALLGLFVGPAMVIPTALAGGIAGGAMGALDEFSKEDSLYDDLKARLKRGTSALVLLAAPEHVSALAEAVAEEAPEVLRREAPPALVAKLERYARHRV